METQPFTTWHALRTVHQRTADTGVIPVADLPVRPDRLIWLVAHRLIELVRRRSDSEVCVIPGTLPDPKSQYGDFIGWHGGQWSPDLQTDRPIILLHRPTITDWRDRLTALHYDLHYGQRFDASLTRERALALQIADGQSKFLSRKERNLISKLTSPNLNSVWDTMNLNRDKRRPLYRRLLQRSDSKFMSAADSDGAARLREARCGDLTSFFWSMPSYTLAGD
jgi:hypothetical protein